MFCCCFLTLFSARTWGAERGGGAVPPSAQRGAGKGRARLCPRSPRACTGNAEESIALRAASLPPGPTALLQTLTARPHPIPKNKSAPDTDSYSCLHNRAPCGFVGVFYNSAGAILTETVRRLHEASGQSEREMRHGSWEALRSWESRADASLVPPAQPRPCLASSVAEASLRVRVYRPGNGPGCPLGAS